MTTKEQERKALEQIKKIVAGLGEDSYVGTAFEGCFEIAEENIENDFACSMQDRAHTAEKNADDLRLKVGRLEQKVKDLETKLEAKEQTIEAKNTAIEKAYARIEELNGQYKQACDNAVENWNRYQDADTKLDEKEDEIIRLKAKLYDLMTK